jgi:hypothetical protein
MSILGREGTSFDREIGDAGRGRMLLIVVLSERSWVLLTEEEGRTMRGTHRHGRHGDDPPELPHLLNERLAPPERATSASHLRRRTERCFLSGRLAGPVVSQSDLRFWSFHTASARVRRDAHSRGSDHD